MKSPVDPLQVLPDAMWDFVDPFISSIGLVLPGDDRQPPGDHHGTGAFVMVGGIPQLLTCEHVARHQVSGTLVYSRFGCDFGTAVGNNFKLRPYPQDVAVASLSRSWRIVKHQGRCIPLELFASTHQPISEEFLYVHGFPGQDAAAHYGQHDVKAVGTLTFEVGFDPLLEHEVPKPIPGLHICVGFNPAAAHDLTEANQVLPLAPGMSGSLLWNTRYREVTSQGSNWQPSDARVTGMIWGASTKAGVLIATPIKHVFSILQEPI